MKRTLALCAMTLMLLPLAIADQAVLGVPDTSCQTPAEWYLHDYGAPATGSLIFLPLDGNIEVCPYGERPLFNHDDGLCVVLEENTPLHDLFCHRGIGSDREYDWAIGGAWLASDSGDGATYGSVACWGMIGHHAQGHGVYVDDLVFNPVVFTVTADYTDPASPVPPDQVDCGDGVIQPCDPTPPPTFGLPPPLDGLNPVVGPVVDTVNALLYSLLNSPGATCTPGDVSKTCVSYDHFPPHPKATHCKLDFPPGIDGVYSVFVGSTTNGANGLPTGASVGHIWTR